MNQTVGQQHEGSATQEGSTFGNVHAYGSSVTQMDNIYARTVKIDSTSLSRTEAALAEGFSNVTLQQVTSFVKRPTLHAAIKSQLHDTLQEPAACSKVVVVLGLGGVGKTQLVLNYIETFRNDYAGTFWINAREKQSVEREFAQIYRLIFLSSTAIEQELPNIEEIVFRVKDWFTQGLQKWLWVFDSADSIEDREDPNFLNIKTFIPSSPSVHVLITTRSSNAQNLTTLKAVKVRELEPKEALDLFGKSSGSIQAEAASKHLEAAESIVKELRYLALAVNLAGSYIAATPWISSNLALYLPEYQERRRILHAQKPNKLIHRYEESVLTIWETSFNAMRRRSSLACNLLTMLAFLNPEDISLDLFTIALSENSRQESEKIDPTSAWQKSVSPETRLDIYDIEEAFAVLESFSFIQRGHIHRSYSMHRLVHAWGHDRLDQAKQLRFGCSAIEFLATVVAHCAPEPAGKHRLVRHLMENFTITSSVLSKDSEDKSTLYFLTQIEQSASFLNGIARWTEESSIEIFVVKQKTRILGEEHPSTISAMNNLANTFGNQGRVTEAEAMYIKALTGKEKVLGPDHTSTLNTVSNLGLFYCNQGKLMEAEVMYQRALTGREKTLGPDHTSTLNTVNNLGLLYCNQGKLMEAEVMYQRVLTGREKNLGPDHTSTLNTVNNLGLLYCNQGKLMKAEIMYQRVLTGREKALGPDHSSTLNTVNNLGLLYCNQGKLVEAEIMYKQVLTGREKTLGWNHMSTLDTVNSLSILYRNQGRLAEAEAIYERVLVRNKKALGTNNLNISSDIYSDITSDISSDGGSVFSVAASTMSSKSSVVPDQIADLAADEFVSLLLGDEEFRFLSPAAIESNRVGAERFKRNFRRLLNQYSIDLKKEARSEVQRAAVYLVRSRSRYIANDFLRKIDSGREDGRQYDKLKGQSIDEVKSLIFEQYLNKLNLTDKTVTLKNDGATYKGGTDQSEDIDSESCSEDDDSDDGGTESQNHENHFDLSRVKDFLISSTAFLMFRENFRQFVHPSFKFKLYGLIAKLSEPSKSKLNSLIMELELVPPGQVLVSYQDNSTFLNYIKGAVEDLTGETWEWWPLKPRMRSLPLGYARLHWRCPCGEERWEEVPANFAKGFARLIQKLPDSSNTHSRTSSQILAHSTSQNTDIDQTGASRVAPSAQSTSQNIHPTSAKTPSANPTNASGVSPSANIDLLGTRSTYVLLGVGAGDFRLAQIAAQDCQDDQFFEQLRGKYNELRGLFRQWFGIWQYAHCDFVKVIGSSSLSINNS
ncbi:MAG: hypothetical protein M1830_009336 [Pleopsidium flavum]|nr:MAG: hypothetical protein M1830_009336 [Pleopsidium flavum]